mmetsp:Transcript_59766/g.155212  ORF Transcript_59766/g.155212 Transcript_59766/m.155212 type:complete len:212 (-) Transcript_59766:351-986(-)
MEASEVAHGPGHVQARVALASRVLLLGVHSMVPASVEEDNAPCRLDALPLLRHVRLVVDRQVNGLDLAFFVHLAQDDAAVTYMRNVENVVLVTVQDHRAGGAAPGGVDLLQRGRLLDEILRLRKGLQQHALRVGVETVLGKQDLGQVVLDEVGDVVTFAAVAVEHAVQRVLVVHLHDEEAVLIRGLRLEALLAGVTNALGAGLELASLQFH